MPLIPALRRQRGAELYDLRVCLIYIVSSRRDRTKKRSLAVAEVGSLSMSRGRRDSKMSMRLQVTDHEGRKGKKFTL